MEAVNHKKVKELEAETTKIAKRRLELFEEIKTLEREVEPLQSEANSLQRQIDFINEKRESPFRQGDWGMGMLQEDSNKLSSVQARLNPKKDRLKRIKSEQDTLAARYDVLTEELKEERNPAYRQSKKEAQYQKLLKEKSRAKGEDDFLYLVKPFREMKGYKDTEALAKECDAKYHSLKSARVAKEEKDRADRAHELMTYDVAARRFASGKKVAIFFEIIALLSLIGCYIFNPALALSPAWVIGGVALIPIIAIFHLAAFMGIANGKILEKIILTAFMLAWFFVLALLASSIIYGGYEPQFEFYGGQEILRHCMNMYPVFAVSLIVHFSASTISIISAFVLGGLSRKVGRAYIQSVAFQRKYPSSREIEVDKEKLAIACEGLAILAFALFVITNPSISLSFWWVVGGLILGGIVIAIHIAVFRGILNGGKVKKAILTALVALVWPIALIGLSEDFTRAIQGIESQLYEMAWSDHAAQIIHYYAPTDFAFFVELVPVVYSTALNAYPVFVIALTVHVLYSIFAAIAALTVWS